jgi:hypothetical protein
MEAKLRLKINLIMFANVKNTSLVLKGKNDTKKSYITLDYVPHVQNLGNSWYDVKPIVSKIGMF